MAAAGLSGAPPFRRRSREVLMRLRAEATGLHEESRRFCVVGDELAAELFCGERHVDSLEVRFVTCRHSRLSLIHDVDHVVAVEIDLLAFDARAIPMIAIFANRGLTVTQERAEACCLVSTVPLDFEVSIAP